MLGSSLSSSFEIDQVQRPTLDASLSFFCALEPAPKRSDDEVSLIVHVKTKLNTWHLVERNKEAISPLCTRLEESLQSPARKFDLLMPLGKRADFGDARYAGSEIEFTCDILDSLQASSRHT